MLRTTLENSHPILMFIYIAIERLHVNTITNIHNIKRHSLVLDSQLYTAAELSAMQNLI